MSLFPHELGEISATRIFISRFTFVFPWFLRFLEEPRFLAVMFFSLTAISNTDATLASISIPLFNILSVTVSTCSYISSGRERSDRRSPIQRLSSGRERSDRSSPIQRLYPPVGSVATEGVLSKGYILR